MPRPNISTAFRTTTMGFVQVVPPALILTFANIVPENTLGNLVPDQRITSSNTIEIMHLPDNQLSIENLKISTPINPKISTQFLKGCDDDIASFLTTGFTFGFKIPKILAKFLKGYDEDFASIFTTVSPLDLKNLTKGHGHSDCHKTHRL